MARCKVKQKLTLTEKLGQALVSVDEQPYDVPKSWCWVKLNFLCKYMRAGGDKPKSFSKLPMHDLKFPVVANGVENDGIVGYTDIPCEEKNTITISGRGTIGYCVYRDYSYYPIVRLLVLNPHDRVNGIYLKYALDSLKEEGTGSSIPQLTIPMIRDKAIPFPPLAEQQRIVDRIESLFAKLDEVKEKLEAIVDSYETRKAAILHKAFSGELTKEWRKDNNISKQSWQLLTFDECISKMQNGLSKRKGDTGVNYVVLRLANLSDEGFIVDDLREILLNEKEQQNYELQLNDILMIRVNGSKDNVGKQFIMGEQEHWAFCDHIIRIRYKDIVNPKFMLFLSKTEKYKIYIHNNMVSSAGQNTISRKGMAKLAVNLPSLKEQDKIVDILEEIFKQDQLTIIKVNKIIENITIMKKAILARAFRGELGTNRPEEESSIELLKQILAEN